MTINLGHQDDQFENLYISSHGETGNIDKSVYLYMGVDQLAGSCICT